MLTWLLERYPGHVAVTTALVLLAVLWILLGLIGYGLWMLVMAVLDALIGVLS